MFVAGYGNLGSLILVRAIKDLADSRLLTAWCSPPFDRRRPPRPDREDRLAQYSRPLSTGLGSEGWGDRLGASPWVRVAYYPVIVAVGASVL